MRRVRARPRGSPRSAAASAASSNRSKRTRSPSCPPLANHSWENVCRNWRRTGHELGHVTLVEGYALTNYTGCHALVALRDTPGKTVAVLTSEVRLQSLLETALATGHLIAFWGTALAVPPTPRGGTWSVEVYAIDGVILYNFN
jgi:hypothetical protein